MAIRRYSRRALTALLVSMTCFLAPWTTLAHPLGNLSISHYARIQVERQSIEIHYRLDMAEIPTFQVIWEYHCAQFGPNHGSQPGIDTLSGRSAQQPTTGARS